jgi:hypothetical protein
MFPDGTFFKDHDIHRILKKKNMEASVGGEWFKCTVNDVKAAIIAIKTGSENEENRTCNFTLRPEQKSAIDKTIRYYTSIKKENPERTPKFLWNAKMRFGKTFTAYKLAKEMGMKKILVLTFKPAVEDAWDEDIKNHVDFEGWQFISNKSGTYSKEDIDRQYGKADKTKPIVCFGSFQDLLGTNNAGGIKVKNEFIHENNWDLVIFDEYHYGAWRDNAKNLFQKSDEEEAYDFDIEKHSCPLPHHIISSCQEHLLEPLTAENLSRNRYITGRIPMNKNVKKVGKNLRKIHMLLFHVWLC